MSHPHATAAPLRGGAYALLSAALFGASAPIAKLLLARGVGPLTLAGVLYCGGALAVAVVGWIRPRREARVSRADLPLLALVTLSGGFAGPALLILGLSRVSGMAGSLLLNLEAPFTILLALTLFREHASPSQLLASFLIIGGAVVLGLRPGDFHADALGVLALAGAGVCWGIDNNLTQRLSVKDPFSVVPIKGAFAGTCNLLLGLSLGEGIPRALPLAGGLSLGAVSYGVSIVLAVLALRELGAARQAAYFATAPFAGALLSIPLLSERPRWADALAMALMGSGAAALARIQHAHRHTHSEIEHEHLHQHDEHHQHAHEGPVTEPHSHPHRHEALTHEHPHASDVHHRHSH